MEFDADLIACAQAVERGDPDRFRAVMAAPVPARATLFPIYAFNLEVARAPQVTREPLIAEMRLQWWRDALAEIAAGGIVRRHEVVTPLAHVLDAGGAAILGEVIDARAADIEADPFADEDGLRRYISGTGGALLWAAARALGPAPEAVARDAGYAQGLAGYLRAIPALEAQGKRPLPDGRIETVAALARDGRARLASARARRAEIPGAARPAFLAVAGADAVLARAERMPERVAAGTLAPAPLAAALTRLRGALTGAW